MIRTRNYDYIAKMVLIGDGQSGKTSLAERFCHGIFTDSYQMTVGANFYSEMVQIENNNVKLQIWDLAGQPRFEVVRTEFYRGAMICLAIFDLTRYNTFKNLEKWIYEMYKKLDELAIPTVLIGNKVDLERERNVRHKEAQKFSESLPKIILGYRNLEVPYFETSAKTGKNVEKAFRKSIEIYLRALEYYCAETGYI